MLSIEMLPANEGDALWVEYGDPRAPNRLLIDCGYKSTYREVLRRLADPAIHLELFVLTHIDADHIAGAAPFIADARVTAERIGEVWFNSREQLPLPAATGDKLGVEQAEYFTRDLERKGFAWNKSFPGGVVTLGNQLPPAPIMLAGGLHITLLSPGAEQLRTLATHWDAELADVLKRRNAQDVEDLLQKTPKVLQPDRLGEPNVRNLAEVEFDPDDTAPNGSSIAFLAEYRDVFDKDQDKAVLFAADAHAPILVDSITSLLRQRGADRLPLSAFKVSHHGSRRNTSKELLALLDCHRFLISTNGTKHEHPDAECIARILLSQREDVHLCFNYDTDFNRMWRSPRLQRQHRYRAHYPEDGKEGLRVEL